MGDSARQVLSHPKWSFSSWRGLATRVRRSALEGHAVWLPTSLRPSPSPVAEICDVTKVV